MKIIFVGVHHKKGMKALDSRTYTGRIIDLIIKEIGDHQTEKINLFPTDYMPNEVEKWDHLEDFTTDNNAIHIALGKVVQKYLQGCHHKLDVNHPGYVIRKGKAAIKEYVRTVSAKITKYIEKEVVHTKQACNPNQLTPGWPGEEANISQVLDNALDILTDMPDPDEPQSTEFLIAKMLLRNVAILLRKGYPATTPVRTTLDPYDGRLSELPYYAPTNEASSN